MDDKQMLLMAAQAAPLTHQQVIALWHSSNDAHSRFSAFEWFAAGVIAAEYAHGIGGKERSNG